MYFEETNKELTTDKLFEYIDFAEATFTETEKNVLSLKGQKIKMKEVLNVSNKEDAFVYANEQNDCHQRFKKTKNRI